MVLETLDVKKNDIFIYSLNKFDLNRNFKLINKDSTIKYPKPIHFNDVCRYLADGRPKNVIVYRLLTNLPRMEQTFLKYGYIMNINGIKEVFYFDPIFAIKELEEYSDIGEYPFLRFRVQQVGLLSMMTSFGEAKYHEIYAFDLEVAEVRYQNDRVFAEIIFAFDEVHFDEEDAANPAEKNRVIPKRKFIAITSEDMKSDFIEEDPSTNAQTLNKLRTKQGDTSETLANSWQSTLRKNQTAEQLPTYTPMSPAKKPIVQNKPAAEPIAIISKAVTPPSPAPMQEQKTEKLKPIPLPAPREEPKVQPRTAHPRTKQTFGDFLNKVKRDIDEREIEEQPLKQERMPVINIFKTSSHISDFVVEREKKQVVLKLKKRK